MTAGDGGSPGPGQDRAGEGKPLHGWPWLTGGLLALVLGALWTAQGLDLVDDSIMSGVTVFAVIGPVVAVTGVALMVLGVRIRARSKQAAPAAGGPADFPGPDSPAI